MNKKNIKKTVSTGINIAVEDLQLLKKVAGFRGARNGVRVSVSSVICDLVDKNRKSLEKECQ